MKCSQIQNVTESNASRRDAAVHNLGFRPGLWVGHEEKKK
jgi:hypothetical protein